MAEKGRKRTKEERDQEFVNGVENLFGYPLLAWQKMGLIEIKRALLAGEDIDIVDMAKYRTEEKYGHLGDRV